MASVGVQTVQVPDLASLKTADQIQVREIQDDFLVDGRHLIQSPYTEHPHLIDLETLDNENALLARALTKFRVLRQDYATAPYVDSFNWPEVISELKRLAEETGRGFRETSFYIVAFRSQIKSNSVYADLGRLDKAAHAEAVASGGFLKYWFGEPDSDLRNLATCIWRTREDARKGGRGPAHREAAGATRAMYAFWKIDQHRLTIRDGVESWDVIPWEE